jgi:ribonuclease HI
MKRLQIKAYCDGACKGNPGRGGWGVVYYLDLGLRSPAQWSAYGGKRMATNNEMELTAFLEVLKLCPTGADIIIHPDSEYVLKAIIKGGKSGDIGFVRRKLSKGTERAEKGEVVFTGYLDYWIRNGWKKKDKKPVKNLELWKRVVEECYRHLLEGSTLKCIWVKGHAGCEGNEVADNLANLGVPKI